MHNVTCSTQWNWLKTAATYTNTRTLSLYSQFFCYFYSELCSVCRVTAVLQAGFLGTGNSSCTSPLSSNELLKQLDWLPIEWRIQFKLATLTFKALHTGRPPYLSDLLQHHEPTKSLISSNPHQLSVPPSQPNFSISCLLIFYSQSLEFTTC